MSTSRPRHPFVSARTWLAYAALLAVAIPWYWPADESRLLLGIPLWAVVSFGASAGISTLTAWLLLRHWPDEGEAADAEPCGEDTGS